MVEGVVVCRCVKCGAVTEWDESLGVSPYCVECWDMELEKIFDIKEKQSEYNSRYRNEHREEIREKNKRYRNEHREEIKERERRYRNEHREERNENQRRWYRENKDKFRGYKSRYRNNHKEEINEYARKLREKHRMPLSDGLDGFSRLARSMTAEERREKSRKAAVARWNK